MPFRRQIPGKEAATFHLKKMDVTAIEFDRKRFWDDRKLRQRWCVEFTTDFTAIVRASVTMPFSWTVTHLIRQGDWLVDWPGSGVAPVAPEMFDALFDRLVPDNGDR